MENGSSYGILGLLLVVAIVFLIIKFAWWLLLIGGILIILFIILLIASSKKSKGDGGASDLEGQVRQALSSIRQQKFKAEAKINRLKEWANDAIETTYGSLFDDKVLRTQLYENYPEIKAQYAEKLQEAQIEKTDQIVNSCLNHMLTEKSKIETLDKLQTEHEQLRTKLKQTKTQQRQNKRLDKHVNRLNATNEDLSGEETIAMANYTIEDLQQEVALKQEYVKQLEDLSLKYGDDIQGSQVSDYQNQLDELKNRL
ncbi:MAG: hypothetical protein JXR68_14095 [Bacteroidales bacterium]|nr:hypothetical protein [Bacteroidales bacterium]